MSDDIKKEAPETTPDTKTTPDGGDQNKQKGTDSKDLEARIADLESQVTHWQTEAKNAFTARDEAKGKLKEQEDAKLIEEKKFSELYDNTKSDLEAVQAENAELKQYKEQVEEQNRLREESLNARIAELPDNVQTFAKSLNLEQKEQYLSNLNFSNDKKTPISTTKGSDTDVPFSERKFESMKDIREAAKEVHKDILNESKGQG